MENLEVDVPPSTNLSHISPSLKVTHDSPDEICTGIPRYLCCKWLTIIFLALAASKSHNWNMEKSHQRFQGPNLPKSPLIRNSKTLQKMTQKPIPGTYIGCNLVWPRESSCWSAKFPLPYHAIIHSRMIQEKHNTFEPIQWLIHMIHVIHRESGKKKRWSVACANHTLHPGFQPGPVPADPTALDNTAVKAGFMCLGGKIFSSEVQIKSATKILKVQNFAFFFCFSQRNSRLKKTPTSPRKTRKSHLDNGESFAEFWVFQSSRLNF